MIPPPTDLKAVVFDLDGLMFNTEDLYQEVGQEILRRRGKVFTSELIDQMMGRQAQKALQLMIDWHQLEETAAALATESMEVMFGLLPNRLAPMPGLLKLLERLEGAGLPKAIATSSSRVFVDRVLAQFEMAPRFAFILTAEDIVNGKPSPDVYLLAAEKHGVTPAEVMVLEDSQIGCQAAVAAGTHTVAVPSGQSVQHQFPGVQLIASSLEDPQIYQALGLA
jgi:HAD superfamily hydrolase (TIGR01509 family)